MLLVIKLSIKRSKLEIVILAIKPFSRDYYPASNTAIWAPNERHLRFSMAVLLTLIVSVQDNIPFNLSKLSQLLQRTPTYSNKRSHNQSYTVTAFIETIRQYK